MDRDQLNNLRHLVDDFTNSCNYFMEETSVDERSLTTEEMEILRNHFRQLDEFRASHQELQ